jgi:hypothetical protein
MHVTLDTLFDFQPQSFVLDQKGFLHQLVGTRFDLGFIEIRRVAL